MNSDERLALLMNDVHIPLCDPNAPRDWKEWYHFILVEPNRGIRVLANVSLSGLPNHGQVIVTLFVTVPAPTEPGGELTYGFCADHEWQEQTVQRAPAGAQGRDFRIVLDGLHSSFFAKSDYHQLALEMTGQAQTTPMFIPELTPHGSSFVGWGLMPVVSPSGQLRIGQQVVQVGHDWFCYHDHNYGRFRWGDDIGWVWFVVTLTVRGAQPASRARGSRLTVVLHRGNNRDQTKRGSPHLFIYVGRQLRKMFVGPALSLSFSWTDEPQLPPRLPAAMASLFEDRALLLPTAISIRARDDVDALELELPVSSCTELVLADDVDRRYTFIEELSGEAELNADIDGTALSAEGYFYAEFVH